jgi:type I restriction enzyme, S subunit
MKNKGPATTQQLEDKSAFTPKLRFPEFRDAEGWGETPLGELGQIVTGKTPSTNEDDLWGGEILFITPTDINVELKYQVSTLRTVVETAATKVLPPGSVVYTCIASIGKMALTVRRSITNQQINAVVPNGKTADEFIYYALANLTPWIKSIPATSTLPIINKTEFSKFIISHPVELSEQQKIAECLSSVDELITAQAQKLDALKTHKKGLLQQLFPREGETQPRLRFPEFRNDGDWALAKAGSIFTNRVSKGEHGLPIYSVTMYDGMVRRDSLDRNYYDIEDAAGNKKVCKNDIAYNMMRMWQGALGVAPEDCLVSPAYIVLAPVKGVVPEFFQYMFKLPALLLILTAHSRGLTKDRLRLYYDDFAIIRLRCPSSLEQQRIAYCLTSLDDLIATQTQTLDVLKIHKNALMQQLFPVTTS